MSPQTQIRRRTRVVATALAALAATACLDVSERSRATAEISGPEGTAVEVVTSTQFVRTQGTSDPTSPDTASLDVRLVTSDTVEREIPAVVERELTQTQRIFVGVVLADSAAAAAGEPIEAEVRLLVDGEQRGIVTGDLLVRPLEVSFASFVSG